MKEYAFYKKLFYNLLKPLTEGTLIVTLPSQERWIFGQKDQVTAEITVVNNVFFKKCILFGDIGFGESFVDGDWNTTDITKVVEWMILNIENHPTLMADKKKRTPINFFKWVNQLQTFFRQNTLNGSRKNISAHYDLSNDFFKLFLDPTMTYSSAIFKKENESLEQAQLNKYEALCRKIKLKSDDRLLEIGTGWGGFSAYAAQKYDCDITTVTISQEQYQFAQKKIAEEGVQDRVKVKLMDYRNLKGTFDKIVSIEMIEAVGYKFLKKYFSQCHDLLKKDGVLALQMILAPDHRFKSFLKNPDFIQKHIFPGSLLPSLDQVQKNLRKTGTLMLYDFEDITSSYAKTLRIWREKFNEKLDKVKKLGFDENFIRKWNYYLAYCEAAFSTHNISVAQAVFSRPNNRDLI